MAAKEYSGKLTAAGVAFAVVVSRFNDFLTTHLLKGAMDCLVRHGADEDKITVVWAPGANEVSSVVERIVKNGVADAYIALGAVVQGATPHADLINAQVSRSLARTGAEHNVPVINGIVCAGNLEQAIERSGTKAGNKGWHAALAAIEMADLYKQV